MSSFLWPFTNMHELNLDWVVSVVKNLIAEWKQTAQDWETQQEAFDSLKSYVENYFKNLDVQDEINNKIDEMIEDGSLQKILSQQLADMYRPIVVSSTTEMTDHSVLYVLSTNGHVYQWDGSAFSDTTFVYTLPENVYSYMSVDLPNGTNIINPVNINFGTYTVNKNNVSGIPADFEGVYGVYTLFYYTNKSSFFALLYDFSGNCWLVQPYGTSKLNVEGVYKYQNSLESGTNIEDMPGKLPGLYTFAASDVTGLPSDFKSQYGYVFVGYRTSNTAKLYILTDTSARVWINSGYSYKAVNIPFYKGPFPNTDVTENIENMNGHLYTVGPTNTNLPPEYGDGNYGFLYNIFSQGSSICQTLYPAFTSSKIWQRQQNNKNWIQMGPHKQIYKEKICFIGDSITAKTFRANVGFVELIRAWTNSAVQNLGVSGSGFNAGDKYIERVPDINADTTIICVSCSFNDLNTLPVGTAEDTDNTTLGGLMNQFFDAVAEKLPLVKIVGYTTNAWSGARPGNETAESYVSVFSEICAKRCIPFTPVWKLCNLRPWIEEQQAAYFTAPGGQTDQTHPNDAGHKLLAPIIYDSILKTVQINM